MPNPAEDLLRRFNALSPRDRQTFLRRVNQSVESTARIGVWTPPPPPPPARRKSPHTPGGSQK